ncbi:HAD family hydrolase [Hymenobacter psychrophilus]|uniref:Putative hydrolase of the HAD superfamily n=1 Tax=Hymenobacter psychrophilus TaxID=651662 RepID=A0A1H3NBJ2_9BACT|nr:HAD family hydrolase [Hymenobacter psychrophilus]SDY86123.1 putative hydrolase of the HAD superfamily [Hymenobacter psychrophilus]
MPAITTILFDLDDTLYDHTATARAALAATAAGRASLRGVPAEALYQRYSDLLEEMHPRVMRGELDYLTARELRFRQLLAPYEAAALTAAALAQLAEEHYGHYRQFRQPVAGALALLQRLKPDYRIGVVTNNRTTEQEEKLDFLGMSGLVDALITSEAVGVLKPDPAIYQVALAHLRARPAETVMVGDNWVADVVGAQAVGIRPVWLNRTGVAALLPAVAELGSLEPLESVVEVLTAAGRY